MPKPKPGWLLKVSAILMLAGPVVASTDNSCPNKLETLLNSAGHVRRAGSVLDVTTNTQQGPTEAISIEARIPELGHARLQTLDNKEVVLNLERLPQGGNPAEPMLPYALVRLLLPPDADLSAVKAKLLSGDWEQLPGEYEIAPVPPAATWDCLNNVLDWGNKNESLIIDGRDTTIYERDAYFPGEPVDIASVGAFRQWKLVEYRVWPVAYNPVRKKLRILRNVRTTLSVQRLPANLATGLSSATPPTLPGSAKFTPEMLRTVANSQDFETFYSGLQGASASNFDYVIITTSTILNNSNKLANFISAKQADGYGVKVVTEDQTVDSTHYLSGSSADGRADNIRSWLQTYWLLDGIEYVLLIGDPHPTDFSSSTSVPMKMCQPKTDREAPTDMYYAELTGTWDADNDSNYGEFTDDYGAGEADKYCELKVGRIPFYGTYPDLDAILQKTIDYGNETAELAWRAKVLIPAAISNHGPQDDTGDHNPDDPYKYSWNRTFGDDWGQATKTLATVLGFSPYTLYEKEGVYSDGTAYPLTPCDANLTQNNVVSEWKTNYGFVTWWGHGCGRTAYRRIWRHDDYSAMSPSAAPDYITQDSIETYPDPNLFTWSDCSQLSDEHPSFVVQVSCMNGYPEDSNNLGYSLLKNGAIGTVCGTRVTWYHVGSWDTGLGAAYGDNASYGYYCFNRMALDNSAGDALVWCRANFGTAWSSGSSWMNMVSFNLYGEPSLSFSIKPLKWFQEPDLTDNGIDVRCLRFRQQGLPGQDEVIIPWDVADDFECNKPGPITAVTFWGSWFNDMKGRIEKIHLSIHDDIPDPNPIDPCTYSTPGNELWSKDFYAGEFTETLFNTSFEQGEWFWVHPPDGYIAQNADRQVWMYHVPISTRDAFIQQGDPCNPIIYWLGIHALLVDDPNDPNYYNFGWKTRDPIPKDGFPGFGYLHFNDDAVVSPNEGEIWYELRYPSHSLEHPYANNKDSFGNEANSIDLAFAIVSFEQQEPPDPPPSHLKWSQPPIEINPNAQTPVYCGWDEKSSRWDIKGVQLAKLLASDGAADDRLGASVSIDGDYAVVGVHLDDDNGAESGSAYIFKRVDTSWIQQAKLTASDGAANDQLGFSTSISGDYAIAGALQDDDNGNDSGSAYVFKRSGTTWTQQAKLKPSDGAADNWFGRSVSISGDYAIAGAHGDDDKGIRSGSAYIFKRSGTTWMQQCKLTASDGAPSDFFGYMVAINRDYAIVSASGNDDDGTDSGSVYIFKRQDPNWIEQAKLTASDAAGWDSFGASLSINGDYAIVGAYRNDDAGSSSGSAYVFKRNGASWSQQAKLTASDAAADDFFGSSVSISGDYIIVGAHGDDDNGTEAGAAYVFKYEDTSWLEQIKLKASDGAAWDYFGGSVSISSNYAVISAPHDDDKGDASGSAYIFGVSNPPWTIAADDFRCLGAMPVTSVGWWGSYIGWDGKQPPRTTPTAWRFGFWSNVADLNPGDPDTYSYPEQLLWQIEVPAESVEQTRVGDDYFPDQNIPSDTCFKYYVQLRPNEYFWQADFNDVTDDGIFWLSIAAIYADGVGDVGYLWGWKTRPRPWMDNAVRFDISGSLEPGFVPDLYKEATYKPIDDTTIDKYAPNYNHGLGYYLIARRGGSGYELDTLLDFDISSIPAASKINSAKVKLYHFSLQDYYSDGRPLNIHRITSPWDQATTTWNTRPTYAPAATSSATLPGSYSWMEWDVTNDVKDFISGSKANYGWEIRDPILTGHPRIYFYSKEFADSNYHPYLEIEYQAFDPIEDPLYGEPYDMAFELDTNDRWIKAEQPFTGIRNWPHYEDQLSMGEKDDVTGEYEMARLVADDWRCEARTPVTAIVWWGSYIGYRYQPCQNDPCTPPAKPDHFLLSIWNDVPDPNVDDPCTYSHPNDIIWEYETDDYDEVLVGYDKNPHGQSGPPREPVFRYSVRLPRDAWFLQKDVNDIFWLSVAAVYDVENEPSHPWGWTNHKHTFNDDAVAGLWDEPNSRWIWQELNDQTAASDDMSFILFTDLSVSSSCADYNSDDIVNFVDYTDFAGDWTWIGLPGCQINADLNCDGIVDFYDLHIFSVQWLSKCP